MTAIKIRSKNITLNGKRVQVYYTTGPWVEGVNPGMIKIRPRGCLSLADLRSVFDIENNSDMREDYFEADSIRVLPGHPLYAQVKEAACS
jgi:hypothetical protein